MQLVFLLSACTSIVAVAMICLFLFANGIPTLFKLGPLEFLTGIRWKPAEDIYGILPMILGSIYVTLGALALGVPVGILTAVFLKAFCPARSYKFLKSCVELLAGIPSVVYGFFGLVVLVPAVREIWGGGGSGSCILTASLLLGLMILPTIVDVAESSLQAVPREYYEGAVALGAGHVRSVFGVVLPAAASGVLAGVVLGVGRAIGETMAVIMVAGNQARMPQGILEGVRTLTTNIVIEMGYATDLHRDALLTTAVVLFVFILLINLGFAYCKRRLA